MRHMTIRPLVGVLAAVPLLVASCGSDGGSNPGDTSSAGGDDGMSGGGPTGGNSGGGVGGAVNGNAGASGAANASDASTNPIDGGVGSASGVPVIPVGFDAYRMWDHLADLRIGQRAYMRSTYD